MKNREIVNLWSFLNSKLKVNGVEKSVYAIITDVKSSKVQWWKGRNYEKLQKEVTAILTAVEKMKPDSLVKLQKQFANKKPEEFSPEYVAALDEFEKGSALAELLDIENDIVIKKVRLEEIPSDLDGAHMMSIDWMIEE